MAALEVRSAVCDLQPAERLSELLASKGDGARQVCLSAPGNFFEQVLPSASVDLSLSGSSYHWLSSTDHLPRPEGCCLELAKFPPAMRDAWAAQARTDWTTILRHRCAELKEGGMLMAIIPCAPCMNGAIERMTQTFTIFEQRGLVRADAKVMNGFVLPAYIYRDAEALREGFAGLPMRLDVCEVRPRRNSYLPEGGFGDGDAADAARALFGRRMAGWCFGWGARLIEDAVEFRSTLADQFARDADAADLAIGMGCGVVLAERHAPIMRRDACGAGHRVSAQVDG